MQADPGDVRKGRRCGPGHPQRIGPGRVVRPVHRRLAAPSIDASNGVVRSPSLPTRTRASRITRMDEPAERRDLRRQHRQSVHPASPPTVLLCSANAAAYKQQLRGTRPARPGHLVAHPARQQTGARDPRGVLLPGPRHRPDRGVHLAGERRAAGGPAAGRGDYRLRAPSGSPAVFCRSTVSDKIMQRVAARRALASAASFARRLAVTGRRSVPTTSTSSVTTPAPSSTASPGGTRSERRPASAIGNRELRRGPRARRRQHRRASAAPSVR